MKLTKRFVGLFSILLVLVILSVVWYRADRPVPPPAGDLLVWVFEDDEAAIQTLVPAFQAEYPGIAVKLRRLTWKDGHAEILAAAANRTLPDVLQSGTTWVSEFAVQGYILPLDEFCYQSAITNPASFYSAGRRQYTQLGDRKAYGIPFTLDTRLLVYNKKLFRESGVDTAPLTWDAVDRLALRLKPAGRFAVAMPENETLMFLTLVWQHDADIFNWKDKVFAFNQPPVSAAAALYHDLFSSGTAIDYDLRIKPRTGEDIFTAFKKEKVASFIAGPWILRSLATGELADIRDRVGLALMPAISNHRSFLGGSVLTISRDTSHKPAAWKFIEFLSRPENQVVCHSLTGSLPAVVKAWSDPILAGNERLTVFREQIENSATVPSVSDWEPVSDLIKAALGRCGSDPAANARIFDELQRAVTALKP